MGTEANKLSSCLQGKYELIGIEPGELFHPKVGHVDLRIATEKQADKLIAAGCKYIVKKATAKASASKATTGTENDPGKQE